MANDLVREWWQQVEQKQDMAYHRIPRALQDRAKELRAQGWLFRAIAAELGICQSTARRYAKTERKPRGPQCTHCGIRLELVRIIHNTDAGRCCDMCYHHVNHLRREPQGRWFWSDRGLAEQKALDERKSHPGRTPTMDEQQRQAILDVYAQGKMTQRAIATRLDVSPSCVYRVIHSV